MEHTPKYGLKKPGGSDYADVAVLNEDMDKLDTALDGLEKGKAGLDPATGKVKPELLPPMNYDPVGSAAGVEAKLGQHTGNKANPHGVTASQVGARPSTWTPSASDVGAVPTARKVNRKTLSSDITLTAADVGARPDTWTPDPVSVGGIPIVTTYTPAGGVDGVDYAADVPGVTELYNGLTIIADIHAMSTNYDPLLNINSLGGKKIRRYLSTNTLGTAAQMSTNVSWLRSGRAVQLMYNGAYWVVMGLTRPAATDLSGTVAVQNGGTGATTAEGARANLGALGLFGPVNITIPVGSWSGSGPYTQNVAVSGVLAAWDWRLKLSLQKQTVTDTRKVQEKAMGCVTYCDTYDGGITLTCYEKKPEVNILAVLSGEV